MTMYYNETIYSILLVQILLTEGNVVAGIDVRVRAKLVTIAQGPVRGYKAANADVFVFRGIPYATTPTGRDRFKAPLPPPTWTEPFEAVNAVACPQGLPLPTIQEDCLVTSVYTPDTEETNLPVMVTVHGGAFQVGSSDQSIPITLVNSTKIIAVNFNYRLGVHGFLCLGIEEAPGNAGMKDQVALLRWVRDNIAAFGGNPDDVTVAGCSAGGASVDLLRLSSVTDGLFNKVIVGSGGNAGSFGIQHDPIANAQYYASALNFENLDDITALANFYMDTSFDELFSQSSIASNRIDSTVVWAPCVERDIGIEQFLGDAPVNILMSGNHKQIPMLYGFADMEGLMRLPFFDTWKLAMNEKFSDFLPGDLEFESIEEREAVAARVKEFYFGDEEVHEGNILTYLDYFTDVLFGYSMLRSVKLNSRHGSSTIYLYEYSFTDENTPVITHTDERGADHCDQFRAFQDEDETIITEEHRHMKAVMRKMVLDFITTGNPVSEDSTLPLWGPADVDRSPHMNLDWNSTLRGPLLQARAQLWDSIYEAHYRTPIPPTSSATSLFTSTLTLFVMYFLVSL